MSKKNTFKKTIEKNPERTIGTYTFNPSFKGLNIDGRINALKKTVDAAKDAMNSYEFDSRDEYIGSVRSYINVMIIQAACGLTYSATIKEDANGKPTAISKFGGWCKRPNAIQLQKISEIVQDFCEFEKKWLAQQGATWKGSASVTTKDGENIDIPGMITIYETTALNLGIPDKVNEISGKKIMTILVGDTPGKVSGAMACFLDSSHVLELNSLGELIHKKNMIITWTIVGVATLAIVGAGTAAAICLANRKDDEEEQEEETDDLEALETTDDLSDFTSDEVTDEDFVPVSIDD